MPMEQRHDNQTFIVKISNCQNGTWQGRVIWADENKMQHFRSALELLRLIDDAIKAVSELQVKEVSGE